MHAEEAAKKLTAPLAKNIAKRKEALQQLVYKICKSHVPRVVFNCYKNYPDLFQTTTSVYISEIKWAGMSDSLPEMKFSKLLTEQQQKQIIAEQRAIDKLVDERITTEVSIKNTLLALGTVARIKDQLPEALEYLPQQQQSTALILNINPIKKTISELHKAATA